MKTIALIFLLGSYSSFAAVLNVKCEFTDATYVNQFSLETRGPIASEGQFSEVDFNIILKKSGQNARMENIVVTRYGRVEVLEAGSVYRSKTKRIVSVEKDSEIEYINLILNASSPLASQIKLHDGTSYFSHCEGN